MSDIIINRNNLSRFNRRLQKALSSQLNQQVPLHTAAALFAKALGLPSEHALQAALDKIHTDRAHVDPEPTARARSLLESSQDLYGDKAKGLLKELEEYFKNSNTQLLRVDILDCSVASSPERAIVFTSKSIKYDEWQCFGLYFEGNPLQYLHQEAQKIEHSREDLAFMENLCYTYFSDCVEENMLLGAKIAQLLQLQRNTGYTIYKNPQLSRHTLVQIANFGVCKEQFIIVDKNYFDKSSTLFLFGRDQYCEVRAGQNPIYDTIEEALGHKRSDEMVIQYCTPYYLKANSTPQAVCSYLLYSDETQLWLVTINGKYKMNYERTSDLIDFKALIAQKGYLPYHNTYGINEPEYGLWQDALHRATAKTTRDVNPLKF